MGNTSAARHLLALFRSELRGQVSPDNLLGAYMHRVVDTIIKLKDTRDERREKTIEPAQLRFSQRDSLQHRFYLLG